MNLFLIGYRGAGKSIVAGRLGMLLRWPSIDTDVEIELRAGKSIATIFDEDGEPAFRDLESAVIADLCRRERHVVGLGGGAVMREENRRQLCAAGKCVWLKASPVSMHRRLSGDPSSGERRPNLAAAGGLDEIRQLLVARTPVYGDCADLVIDTDDKEPNQIAQEIAEWLGPWLDATPEAG